MIVAIFAKDAQETFTKAVLQFFEPFFSCLFGFKLCKKKFTIIPYRKQNTQNLTLPTVLKDENQQNSFTFMLAPVEASFEDDICSVCTVRAPQFCILVLILSSPFNTSLPYRPRAACLTCQVIIKFHGSVK